MDEVVAFEEQRRVEDAGERVGEAVAVVQPGGMAGAAAEAIEPLDRHPHEPFVHRLQSNAGSRENLLRAVVRDARTFPLPDPDNSAVDWLAGLVRAYLENVAGRRPSARAFLQMWGEAIAADPVLMPLYAEEDAGFRRLVADKVREGHGDGSVRADADPEAMAVFLVGLLRGIALQLISTPPPERVEAIIEEAERSTRRALEP